MLDYHSTTAHAAYIDLVRSLRDDAVADLRGSPVRHERNGRIYWYDGYRVGNTVKKRYIGEDSDELRARLDSALQLKAETKARAQRRARLVRLLRAEGLIGIDGPSGSLLSAFADAGVFRLGGTLVGTTAFRLYEGELGVRLSSDELAQTDDIDIASFERLSLVLDDTVSRRLNDVLGDFEFSPIPSLDRHKVWRWKQSKSDLMVEFLTPAFGEGEGLRSLKALGVDAQALRFLNFLIAEPITAAALYRNGVLVQVPRPERYAVHKLIVAARRHAGEDSLKAVKDRKQAAFLCKVLSEDRPGDLLDAWEDARGRGPKWRDLIDRSLEKLPDTQAAIEAVL